MLLKAVTISCILALACGAPANKGSRIVGGQLAKPGQFKHQVSLQLLWINNDWRHSCGGSIISSKAILTTASCYFSNTSRLRVLAGSITGIEGGTAYKIKSFTRHEDYNSYKEENDIAIIIVEGEIEFNDVVAPIKLASYDIGGDVSAVISGWGLTNPAENERQDLHWLETKTISYEQCVDILSGLFIFESQVCTFTRRDEGVCYGDLGGPLVIDGELHGIISQFTYCAFGQPDVSTKVYSFIDWIQAHAQ